LPAVLTALSAASQSDACTRQHRRRRRRRFPLFLEVTLTLDNITGIAAGIRGCLPK